MRLPDTNLWLALSLSKHSHHSAARRWLDQEVEPDAIWFCRATQQSFVRLLTTAAVLRPYGIEPLGNQKAWAAYEAFMADARIGFRDEPPGIEAAWKRLAVRRGASPKLWMDAYLAAFAISSGAQLVTIDSAFAQFSGLNALVIERA